jgi:hypothetical protein
MRNNHTYMNQFSSPAILPDSPMEHPAESLSAWKRALIKWPLWLVDTGIVLMVIGMATVVAMMAVGLSPDLGGWLTFIGATLGMFAVFCAPLGYDGSLETTYVKSQPMWSVWQRWRRLRPRPKVSIEDCGREGVQISLSVNGKLSESRNFSQVDTQSLIAAREYQVELEEKSESCIQEAWSQFKKHWEANQEIQSFLASPV